MSPRLIGYGVVGLLAVAFIWWLVATVKKAERVDVAEAARDMAIANLENYQAKVEEEARRAALKLAADQRADQALNARVATLQSTNEALQRALLRLSSTVEITDAQGRTRLAINADWWLCRSSQLSRDPADIAACQARAGDGSVPNSIRR